MADLELHPGAHIALARGVLNETQVAKAIKLGELTSPQAFGNSWYFALRITGSGGAYRAALKEYVWRDPSIYLNQEFLDRCNGLPVVLEHPPKEMLDSKEFAQRSVGTIVLPYLKDDEVWGIARILDRPTADYMREHQVSTSPGVVFTSQAVSEKIKAADGKHLLIEGKPALLDHLAICEEGVWDKGGGPTGVDSTTGEEATVADTEEKREEVKEDETEEKKENEEREDSNARLDAKIDKMLKGIKVLADRMDGIEARHGDEEKEEKKDASASEEAEQAEELHELAEEEEKEAAEAAKEEVVDKKDKGRRDARRRDEDEKELPWEKADRQDGEEDEEYSDRMDALAEDCGAKDWKKRDDESMAAHCDRVSRGGRRDRARRADRARMDSIDRLADSVSTLSERVDRQARASEERSTEDENAFADAQARADSIFQAVGDPTPRFMRGENLIGYRIRLARKLQKHSPAWKDTDVAAIARTDSSAFANMEGLIYADAQKAAMAPSPLASGKLRPIVKRLSSGHTETTFVGAGPLSWMSTFMAPGRTTTRLRAPRSDH